MSDIAVVQFVGSLGRNRGGLTKSLYDRSRILTEARRIIFINLSQQRDAEDIFSELQADKKIPIRAELVNFFSEIAASGPTGTELQSSLAAAIETKTTVHTEEQTATGTAQRYFVDGKFIGLRAIAVGGGVLRDEHHAPDAPWKVTHRDLYGHGGHIWKREYLAENFKPRYQILYNETGGAYFASWIYENGTPYRITIFDRQRASQYPDVASSAAPWLARYIASLGKCILISDEPQTLPCLYLPGYNRKEVRTVAVIHTTHYKNHTDPTDGFKSWFPQYLDNRERIDRYVFFTNSQRKDFLRDAGAGVKTVVVAHPAPIVKESEVTRDPNLIATISRLEKGKRISDAILAFSKVVDQFPDLRYHIYGSGPDHDVLQSLISKLRLNDKVILRGYTDTPLDVFQSASLSLITSLYEGFGLTLLESMSCGCPIAVYDVKYGPREIVESGKSGLLVHSGSVDDLAAALARMFGDRDFLARMARGAKERAAGFSVEKWEDAWREVAFGW